MNKFDIQGSPTYPLLLEGYEENVVKDDFDTVNGTWIADDPADLPAIGSNVPGYARVFVNERNLGREGGIYTARITGKGVIGPDGYLSGGAEDPSSGIVTPYSGTGTAGIAGTNSLLDDARSYKKVTYGIATQTYQSPGTNAIYHKYNPTITIREVLESAPDVSTLGTEVGQPPGTIDFNLPTTTTGSKTNSPSGWIFSNLSIEHDTGASVYYVTWGYMWLPKFFA